MLKCSSGATGRSTKPPEALQEERQRGVREPKVPAACALRDDLVALPVVARWLTESRRLGPEGPSPSPEALLRPVLSRNPRVSSHLEHRPPPASCARGVARPWGLALMLPPGTCQWTGV